MMQAVYHQFPGVEVEYEFKCRSGEDLSPYATEIRKELEAWCTLGFSENELEFLDLIPFIKKDFIEFLRFYKPSIRHFRIEEKPFAIKVIGPWLLTILFEVPVLAIVNEVYFKNTVPLPDYTQAEYKLKNKLRLVQEQVFHFADFGTRTRFSHEWQEMVVRECTKQFSRYNLFNGTSNVFLAMLHRVRPIGTMAHEWIQAGQAVGVRLIDSQKYMLQKWVDEYRGDLGIALTDTIGIDAFLRDFDKYFAKLYDGVRHDSGDPDTFAIKVIDHYQKLGIDPTTKTIVFSDGLTFEKAAGLERRYNGSIKVSFGIGTNLTNDFPGVKPLSIIMKMQRCNGQPVAKISDEPEKAQCQDPNYLAYLKSVFEIV
jgi:nicotinate phosphoribosyltransferase